MPLEVMNTSKFSRTIEEIVVEKKIPYMDAIVSVSYTHLRAHET